LPEEEVLALERQHLIRRAVAALGRPCRELLTQLFYRDEPPAYAEISRDLGMPVSSIGPTRGRCLAKLKAALKKIGFDRAALYFFALAAPLIS
jgi:DNA-directed RNA polymerase specialized sigma24 family protein